MSPRASTAARLPLGETVQDWMKSLASTISGSRLAVAPGTSIGTGTVSPVLASYT